MYAINRYEYHQNKSIIITMEVYKSTLKIFVKSIDHTYSMNSINVS